MAVVTKRPAGKDFLDTPKSKLSQSKFLTDPTDRAPLTHKYNVKQGESQLIKAFK